MPWNQKRTEPLKIVGGGAEREHGAALVLVLWFTLIISMIAAAVAATGQSDAKIAINLVQAAKAEALAEGGLQMALAALSRRQTTDPWAIDGRPREVRFEDAVLTIEIRDEDAKLNLNSASQEDMEGVFAVLGRPPGEAQAMAEALLARRADSRIEVIAGSGGRQRRLRSGGFFILGDVQGVTGLSDDEHRILRNHVSLFSPLSRPGRIPDVDQQRQAIGRQALTQPRSESGTYGITVRVEHLSGARAQVYAVVRRAPRRPAGFAILHWE